VFRVCKSKEKKKKFEICWWFQRCHHHKHGFGPLEQKTIEWFGNTRQGIERQMKIDANNYLGV